MKTYLISIQKQHNENIFTGKKRFEGRKKIPKTIEIKNYLDNTMTYTPQSTDTKFVVYEPKNGGGCGKVIGEFICDYAQSFRRQVADFKLIAKALCVSIEFAKQYFDKDIGYMMRICEPKLYDEPKELGEFRTVRFVRGYHKKNETMIERLQNSKRVEVTYVSKAPQNYMRIEEV